MGRVAYCPAVTFLALSSTPSSRTFLAAPAARSLQYAPSSRPRSELRCQLSCLCLEFGDCGILWRVVQEHKARDVEHPVRHCAVDELGLGSRRDVVLASPGSCWNGTEGRVGYGVGNIGGMEARRGISGELHLAEQLELFAEARWCEKGCDATHWLVPRAPSAAL